MSVPARWLLSLTTCALLIAGLAAPASAAGPDHGRARGGCALGSHDQYRHVVYLQFDNVHLTRDNPDVPSDMEQMPHLQHFLQRNGTIFGNDHDVLQHTATNFVSAMTGLYPDRHGVTQSNSYGYFRPDGTVSFASSFSYWTAPLDDFSGHPTDRKHNIIYSAHPAANPTGRDRAVPAPWVPFTRAGCDVGFAGMPGPVLENTATDIPLVFGAKSPEAREAAADPSRATADFVGLALHCARGSAACAPSDGGVPDTLPGEPGGYHGYRALFGSKYLQPVIHPGGPVTSLSGQIITDSQGREGFPGFDSMTPDNALAYAADMQEHGIPVTYTYLSDVHDNHGEGPSGGWGPGEAGYDAQLHAYDQGFAAFLRRLAGDGITTANTLFVVADDEGDHFVGGPATPPGCDGVTTPCHYATKGELNVNMPGLLAAQTGNTTPFAIHNDPAPAIYVTGNPARTDAQVRALERDTARLSVDNPLSGRAEPLARYLADPVEEKILHLVSADGARTPTFTLFGYEDYYVTSGTVPCGGPCVTEPSSYVWNHGTVAPDMNRIWLGLAGPGVLARGIDPHTWTDQTDVRPTMMALLGLHDDYATDGRVLIEDLDPAALPRSLRAHHHTLLRLGQVYKQLEAGPGAFGLDTLVASTRALVSGSAGDDGRYAAIESRLTDLGAHRDALGTRIGRALLAAAFQHRPLDQRHATGLIRSGRHLLARAHQLATS